MGRSNTMRIESFQFLRKLGSYKQELSDPLCVRRGVVLVSREPPEDGLMCELLWSDPHPGVGRVPSKRGVGVAFGADVTREFLKSNNLDLLVRSHEVGLEALPRRHVHCLSTRNSC